MRYIRLVARMFNLKVNLYFALVIYCIIPCYLHSLFCLIYSHMCIVYFLRTDSYIYFLLWPIVLGLIIIVFSSKDYIYHLKGKEVNLVDLSCCVYMLCIFLALCNFLAHLYNCACSCFYGRNWLLLCFCYLYNYV
jgi:hypothetical protein